LIVRAAVLHPDHRLELRELSEPAPDADQVLVAPTVVGLCGSDVSYATKGANGSFVMQHPMVLGHEVTARLLTETTVDDSTFPPGTLVVVHPLWPSPPRGESSVPADLAHHRPSFLGSASTMPHTNGGLAERIAVRPQQLRVVPRGLPADCAVLAEPLAVVLHALGRLPVPVAGRRVLVCGAGPIGLLTAACLSSQGAAHVAVTDLHRRPLDLAVALGADAGLQVPHETPVPDSYDIAVEATGVISSMHTALSALAPGGHLLQLGMLPRDLVLTSLAPVVTKELTVTGSHRFAGELDAAISFLAEHPECGQIVTHRLPLAEAAQALRLAGDPARASKVVVVIESAIR
jgi:L-idonate 5-dehydrogenase